ncbi:acyl-CoA thioesterase [Nocardioides nanhaiensis]|uniref:Acyl-CoA thioesterase n=1 Tax=Nocardioides nanhaiensis TaxID=1476871 RepID=A0ABP8W3V4_9ACTN
MRHVYECPLRWADLDQLGHVNNVTYVDYLQEARVDLLRSHARRDPGEALTEGVVVVRHEVTYLTPLTFRFRPVKIECWVTEIRAATFTMAYEVFHDDGPDGERTVYLRALTVLSPFLFATEQPRRLTEEEKTTLAAYLEPAPRARPDRFAVDRATAHHYPVHVRFSDVDVYGHVNNVLYFTYLQEARVRWFAEVNRGLETAGPQFVIAQTDVDYRAPLLFRPEPYDLYTRLARLGTRSFSVESEICDGERVLARARVAMVFFDLESGRSREPDPAVRERLEARLERDAVTSG